jgi:hypothetical protein
MDSKQLPLVSSESTIADFYEAKLEPKTASYAYQRRYSDQLNNR